MDLDRIPPASPQAVSLYAPYAAQANRRSLLPAALGLYGQGCLEGERRIEAGDPIPFVASWFVRDLPSDQTRCRLCFNGDGDLSFELTLPNHEFINALIDLLQGYQSQHRVDFDTGFYRRLLAYEH